MKLAWHNDEWNRIIGERETEKGKELQLERFEWWRNDVWVLESQITDFKDYDF